MTRRAEPDPRRLIAAHEAANEFYRSRILAEPRAVTYLCSRGIVAATAHARPWTLGYAPRGWTQLRDHLRRFGYTDEELMAAGLVTTARNGNLIDVFRDRVTFPIRNADGDIVAFTGRDLSGRANTPKYRNTRTTAVYSKKQTLYGLTEQLRGGAPPAAVMLVEGPADVVAIARLRQSAGPEQPYVAVAPCGTALTAEQVAQLAAAVPPGTPLVVAYDSDAAGQAALDRSYQLLRDWPGPVEAIALPAGTDPAELVTRGRAAALQALEQARRPLVDLLVDQRLARFRLDEIPGRFAALHAAAPLIADAAARDVRHAAALSARLASRLNLSVVTVIEAVYPPDEEAADDELEVRPDLASADARAATPLGAPGYPDPSLIAHEYARVCPPSVPATTWVEHDPATGHTAWVVAEGVTDSPGDRDAARLAAEVAGRAAVLVGAYEAVKVARAAVNAHFAQPGTGRGDATIAVVTSFDGPRPVRGRGQLTVAWAGDVKVYGSTGRWFALLTAEHNLRGQARRQDANAPAKPGDGALTSSVRGGAVGVNRIDMPVSQLLFTGRALAHADLDSIRRVVECRSPIDAVAQLAGLGGAHAAALIIRPHRNAQASNAARLASRTWPTGPPREAPTAFPARAIRSAPSVPSNARHRIR